jgi:hypothetical protein
MHHENLRFRNPHVTQRLVFLMLLLCCYPARGTTIVVIRNDQAIVIAADSRLLEVTSGGGVRTAGNSECKVQKMARFFWASAQLDHDDVTGFSVQHFVATAGRFRGTLFAQMSEFERIIAPALLREVTSLKTRDPNYYHALLVNSFPALEIVFFGVEKKELVLHFRQFIYKKAGRNFKIVANPVRAIDCPGVSCHRTQLVLLGEYRAIASFMLHPTWPTGITPIDAARKLVEIEEQASPTYVGGPITEFVLNTNSEQWVADEVGCQKQWNKSGAKTPKATGKGKKRQCE